MTRITILLLVVVAFSAVPVAADDDTQVLWDQGLDYESMNGGWMIYGEYYTQDDFTLETDADIEVVEFWAYYYPEEPAYHLSFWANVRYDQYGMPGAYYFRDWVNPVYVEEIDTGYEYCGCILYQYRLNIEPQHIDGGTPFWLEIRSDAENCKWGFENGVILYFQWDRCSQDTFFRLLGTPDESNVEPASWGVIKAVYSD
jgi:hypothetical protein